MNEKYLRSLELTEKIGAVLGIRLIDTIIEIRKIVDRYGEETVMQKLPTVKSFLTEILKCHGRFEQAGRYEFEKIAINALESNPSRISDIRELATYLEMNERPMKCESKIIAYTSIIKILEVIHKDNFIEFIERLEKYRVNKKDIVGNLPIIAHIADLIRFYDVEQKEYAFRHTCLSNLEDIIRWDPYNIIDIHNMQKVIQRMRSEVKSIRLKELGLLRD